MTVLAFKPLIAVVACLMRLSCRHRQSVKLLPSPLHSTLLDLVNATVLLPPLMQLGWHRINRLKLVALGLACLLALVQSMLTLLHLCRVAPLLHDCNRWLESLKT